MTDAFGPDALERRLRAVGADRYHDRHPFHRMLHSGRCGKGQVQAWALNRYYYQAMIPLKDAALIARCEDRAVRRAWRTRLADQDDGGIDRWLQLTDGLGLPRADVVSTRLLLPATRFAVQAYVQFVRERTLLEAIASALTELFSPQIIGERLEGMLAHYEYVSPATMAYFRERPPQAERDAEFALEYVKQHARTPGQQDAVVAALRFKCDVLWAMLDALHHAYVSPGLVPPGAFTPAESGAAPDAVPDAVPGNV